MLIPWGVGSGAGAPCCACLRQIQTYVQIRAIIDHIFATLGASAAACWTTANCRTGLQHPSHGQETFPRMSLGQEKQGSAGIKCSEHGHLVGRGIYLKPFGAIRRAVRAEEILD